MSAERTAATKLYDPCETCPHPFTCETGAFQCSDAVPIESAATTLLGFNYLPGAETPDQFRERVMRQVVEEWEETHAFLDEIGVPRIDDPRSHVSDAERVSLPSRVRGLADRLGRAVESRG